jgi:hypothetical protein
MKTRHVSPQVASPPAPLSANGAAAPSARTTRLTGYAGLASFALIIIAALVARPLWNAPGTSASGADVAAYVYGARGRTIASLLMYSLAMGLFLCFAAGLWAFLRQKEPAPQPLSATFALAAVALVTLILAAFVTGGVLSYRPQQAAIAQSLRDITFGLLALSGIPTAVCLGAYGVIVGRCRCLPRWTAWLAGLGAATHLLIAASFVSHGALLSLEGSVIFLVPGTLFAWILATSVVMLRAGPQTD